MIRVCSYCLEECDVTTESGKFDADGPRGTIRGNLGDTEVSLCCKEEIIEKPDPEEE